MVWDWRIDRLLLALLPDRAPLWRLALGLPLALLVIAAYATVSAAVSLTEK